MQKNKIVGDSEKCKKKEPPKFGFISMDKRGTNGYNPLFARVYKEKETTFDKSIYLVITSSQLSNI